MQFKKLGEVFKASKSGNLSTFLQEFSSIESAAKVLKDANFMSEADKVNALKTAFGGMTDAAAQSALGISSIATASTGAVSGITSIGTALKAAFITNPIFAVTAAITAGIAAFTLYKSYIENIKASVKESASDWSSSDNSLNDNITKIQSLKEALSSGSLTEQEVYNTKSQLLEIQQSLTESYGEQASGIDLVNGKLETQIGLLNSVKKEDANKFLNEQGKNVDFVLSKMEGKMGGKMGGISGEPLGYVTADTNAQGKDVLSLLSKYKEKGIIASSPDPINNTINVSFSGNPQEAIKVLNDFLTDLNSIDETYDHSGFLDGLLPNISGVIQDAQAVIDEYSDTYKQIKQAQSLVNETEYKVTGSSQKAQSVSDWMNDLTNAVNAYNDALLSGDQGKINDAAEQYESVSHSIGLLLDQTSMGNFKDLFDDINNGLDTGAANANKFSQAIAGNGTDALSDRLKTYADTLSEYKLTDVDFMDAVFTDGDQKGESSINAILSKAEEIGVISDRSKSSVQAVADLLVQAGVLASDVQDEVNTTAKSAIISFEDIMNNTDDDSIGKKIDDYQTQIQAISADLEGLRTDGLSSDDLIELIQEFPELATQTDNLEQALSNLSLDKLKEILSSVDDAMADVSSPDGIKAVENLKQQLIDAADLSGLDADSVKNQIQQVFGTESTDELKATYGQYKSILAQAKELGVDTNQTVFGNIDTNNRQVLQWTDDTLEQYKSALQSWDNEALTNWKQFSEDMKGSFSTVYGGSENYQGTEIAFSPILQTDDGPVLLSKDTVDKYINTLLDSLGDDWNADDLLSLDAKGFIIDGEGIRNLIADIGDTAIKTGEAMHFTGTDGAINDALKTFQDAAEKAGMSADDALKTFDDEWEKTFGDKLDNADDREILFSLAIDPDAATWDLDQWVQKYNEKKIQMILDVKADKEATEKAISEITTAKSSVLGQSTGKSISIADFDSDELKDYRSALEYVNGSLQLNAERVDEISKAKAEDTIAQNNENKALAQAKYQENAKELDELRAALENTSESSSEYEDIMSQINALTLQNDSIVDACSEWDLLNTSIREATGTYQAWLDAQNASESGDMFDDAQGAWKLIRSVADENSDMYGRVGREDYKAAVKFIIPDSVDQSDAQAVQSYMDSVAKYMTFDKDGSINGLNIDSFVKESLNQGLLEIDEATGDYKVAGGKVMQDFADGLNLSLPVVQSMFGELEEFGAEFNWGDEAFSSFSDAIYQATVTAEDLQKQIDEINAKPIKTEADLTQLEQLKAELKEANQYKDELSQNQVETASNVYSQYQTAVGELGDLKHSIDVDPQQIEDAETKVRDLKTQLDSLDVPTTAQIDVVINGLEGQKQTLESKIENASPGDIGKYQSQLDALNEKIASVNTLKVAVDNGELTAAQRQVDQLEKTKLTNKQVSVDVVGNAQSQLNAIKTYLENLQDKTIHLNVVRTSSDSVGGGAIAQGGNHSLNGTAHVTGNFRMAHAYGRAMADGSWGAKEGGLTLVGELGREIVVDPHTGKWHTVGDNGAEFTNIPAGAIVFNHLQSEALLNRGFVNERGTADVNGTALVSGNLPSNIINKANTKQYDSNGNALNSGSNAANTKATDKNTSAKNANTKATKESTETFDHIQTKLSWWADLIQKAGDAITDFTNSARKLVLLSREQRLSSKSMNDNYRAMEIYAQKMSTVDLSDGWKRKIRLGDFSIDEIKTSTGDDATDKANQELIDTIKKYQDLNGKMKDCSATIQELVNKQTELFNEKIQTRIDAANEKMERHQEILENISKAYELVAKNSSAALGKIVSTITGGKNINNSASDKATRTRQQKGNYLLKNYKLTDEEKASVQNGELLSTEGLNPNSAKYKRYSNYNKAVNSERESSINGTIKLLNQGENATVRSKKTARNTAKENYETANNAYNSASKAYNKARDTAAKQQANVRKKYSSALNATQRGQLKNGEQISLEGIDPNSQMYKDVLSYNKAQTNKTIRRNNLTAATKQRTSTKSTYDQAELDYAEAYANQSTNKLKNIKDTYDSNASLRSSRINNREANITDTKKTSSSDYDGIIKEADALAKDKHSAADAYEKKMLEEAKAGRLKGQALEDAKAELNSMQVEAKQADEDAKNYRLKQGEVKLDKWNRRSEIYDQKNASYQNDISMKQTKGFDLTESDYQKSIDLSKGEIFNNNQRITELKKLSAQVEVGSEKWREYQNEIANCEQNNQKLNESVEEQSNNIQNLPIERLSKALDILDAIADVTSSGVSYKKAKGEDLSESDYISQMNDNSQKIANERAQYNIYKSKYDQAVANGGAIDGKSAQEWQKEMLGAQSNINNLQTSNEELKKSLRDDVYWRTFERMHDSVNRVTKVLKGMDGLITEDEMFDLDGNMTDAGYLHMANVVKQYEKAQDEVKNYTADIANLNDLYAKGQYSEEDYKKKLEELQEGLLNSAQDVQNLEQTMISYYKKSGQAQLDALFKLIDARKKDLDRRKEAYNWSKQTRESNKELTNIEAQIAAYENLGEAATDSTKAKLAELKAQKKDKQDEIADSLQEHEFELSSQALDDLKDNMQDAFDESIKVLSADLANIMKLMGDAKNISNAHAAANLEALNKLLAHYGIDPVKTTLPQDSIPGHKNGLTHAAENAFSWAHENGAELIRKSDGAVLTRLEPGDSISSKLKSLAMLNAVNNDLATYGVQNSMPRVTESRDNTSNINIHYDSLITVNGDVDKDVWPGMKAASEQLYDRFWDRARKDMGVKKTFR